MFHQTQHLAELAANRDPKYVIDYVILHELLHTKILNHSHRFWVHLRAVCPCADAAMNWLKLNHHACTLYGLTPEESKIAEAAS